MYMGVHKHFKGGFYKPLLLAIDSDDHKTTIVVYVSMEDGQFYTRLLASWNEQVSWPDGKMMARFIPWTGGTQTYVRVCEPAAAGAGDDCPECGHQWNPSKPPCYNQAHFRCLRCEQHFCGKHIERQDHQCPSRHPGVG